MIWTARRRGLATAFLSCTAVLLLIGVLNKHGILTWETLANHKDALSAASSALGILAIVVGGVLSYFRFFHGRTFSTRGELDLSVRIYQLPNDRLLHAICLSLKNVGASALWNPQAVIALSVSDQDGSRDAGPVRDWFDPLQPADSARRVSVIDTGETARFLTQRTFEPSIWTVTYMASVSCDSGDVWKHVHIVRNAVANPERA